MFTYQAFDGQTVTWLDEGRFTGPGAVDAWLAFFDDPEIVSLPPVGPSVKADVKDPIAALLACITGLGPGDIIAGTVPDLPWLSDPEPEVD